jgi:hypothetical protein
MEATHAALLALLGPMLAGMQPQRQQPIDDGPAKEGTSAAFSRKGNRRLSQVELVEASDRAKTAVPALALVASLQQQAHTSPRRWSTDDASTVLASARQSVIAVAPSPRQTGKASTPSLARKAQSKTANSLANPMVATAATGDATEAQSFSMQNPAFSRPIRAHSDSRLMTTGAMTPRMSPREQCMPAPRYSFLLRAWQGSRGPAAAPTMSPSSLAQTLPAMPLGGYYHHPQLSGMSPAQEIMMSTLQASLAEIRAQEIMRAIAMAATAAAAAAVPASAMPAPRQLYHQPQATAYEVYEDTNAAATTQAQSFYQPEARNQYQEEAQPYAPEREASYAPQSYEACPKATVAAAETEGYSYPEAQGYYTPQHEYAEEPVYAEASPYPQEDGTLAPAEELASNEGYYYEASAPEAHPESGYEENHHY